MKKMIAMVLCLVLALSLAGCAKEPAEVPEVDNANIILEDISSITLNAYGKTVQINDADEIAEIKSVIESIAFEPASSGTSVEAPGAISVTVTLGYQDGSRQEITYPYYLHDGNTYAADETSIVSFDKYFD